MAICERCGKGEAEWRCQVCGRVVCTACMRRTDKGVFCLDHVPKKGSKALKQLFMMLLFLTIGLGLIVLVGEILILQILGQVVSVEFVQTLKSSARMLVAGMAGLTAVIGIAWLVSRR